MDRTLLLTILIIYGISGLGMVLVCFLDRRYYLLKEQEQEIKKQPKKRKKR